MSTVLIVDDEIDIQSALSFALKDEGYEVLTASSPEEAEVILSQHVVDIALFDVWFPVGDGMELLRAARAKYPDSVVIMMSGHGNIELALNAIRLGAYDFLEKPLELEKVLVTLRNAAETRSLRVQNQRLMKQITGSGNLHGTSEAVKSLRTSVEKAAPSHAHVLITGENGSGKELVARLLHRMSPRKDKPFVVVNCCALGEARLELELFGSAEVPGRFEQADSGTLFLDEIAELSLPAQARLLRVVEERVFEKAPGRQPSRTEARIFAATNRDLTELIREGKFREDLYFRLKVLALHVPPLRERREDIADLTKHFATLFAAEYGGEAPVLHEELLRWMTQYDWPGNVRELRNLVERMLIMSGDRKTLGPADLPEELQAYGVAPANLPPAAVKDSGGPLRDLRVQFEKAILEQRLTQFGGNVTRAAESLGIERAHLHRKLKQYGLRQDA